MFIHHHRHCHHYHRKLHCPSRWVSYKLSIIHKELWSWTFISASGFEFQSIATEYNWGTHKIIINSFDTLHKVYYIEFQLILKILEVDRDLFNLHIDFIFKERTINMNQANWIIFSNSNVLNANISFDNK